MRKWWTSPWTHYLATAYASTMIIFNDKLNYKMILTTQLLFVTNTSRLLHKPFNKVGVTPIVRRYMLRYSEMPINKLLNSPSWLGGTNHGDKLGLVIGFDEDIVQSFDKDAKLLPD